MTGGRPCIRCLLLVACIGLAGCSPWLQQTVSESRLPVPAMSSDSVVLEIAFVHLGPDDADAEKALWQELDEQALPVDLRRDLAANGIKAAVASTLLPQGLRTLVARTSEEQRELPAGDDVTSGETASIARQRRMQMRSGRRGKVVVTSTLPQISVLAKDREGHVQGDAFRDAQCLFSLRTFPEGGGRTRLQLTPEIEHGDLKNRWVPIDGTLVHQVGKDRQVYDRLRLDLELSPGETLILGPTHDASGLGQHFFTATQPVPKRTLLLVRLAQSQQDELFTPPREKLDLSTLLE